MFTGSKIQLAQKKGLTSGVGQDHLFGKCKWKQERNWNLRLRRARSTVGISWWVLRTSMCKRFCDHAKIRQEEENETRKGFGLKEEKGVKRGTGWRDRE